MGQVFIQFLWLGCVSFGGPAAHIGYFQRTFVERLGWLTQAEFAQLLALCQLLPGPASSQLGFAIYRQRAGLAGALAAFAGFTLPPFCCCWPPPSVWASSATTSGSMPPCTASLLALVVVADAVLTMSRQFCKTTRNQGIMVATAAALWWQPGLLTQLVMLAGAALLCARIDAPQTPDPQPSPAQSMPVHQPHWPTLLLFALLFVGLPLLGGPVGQLVADFYRAGSLVFGGGHVVLPLLAESVGHSLNQQQFLTGYSLAQLVPGPMFTLATYLGAQLLPASPVGGALLATLALFLPGFCCCGPWAPAGRAGWPALASPVPWPVSTPPWWVCCWRRSISRSGRAPCWLLPIWRWPPSASICCGDSSCPFWRWPPCWWSPPCCWPDRPRQRPKKRPLPRQGAVLH